MAKNQMAVSCLNLGSRKEMLTSSETRAVPGEYACKSGRWIV